MNSKIKIGIPRGLLYYRYYILWEEFLNELNCEVVVSLETTEDLVTKDNKYCLPLRIYIGHIKYLKDKVDYILVPRISCHKNGIYECPVFSSLYDIINTQFKINMISYNIDVSTNNCEESEFIKLGEKLGFSKSFSLSAYKKAKKELYKRNKINYLVQCEKLKGNKQKILVVGYDYILNDNLFKNKIEKGLTNFEIIYSYISSLDFECDLTYYEDLINNFITYQNDASMVIFVTTYSCISSKIIEDVIDNNLTVPYKSILVDDLIKNKSTLEFKLGGIK